ncbi:MAG: protein disulfide oxidoreductase [Thiocapsa sp.]|jgi:peroxiredoxin|nr:protein disulfide oxidoreductase [Thiocapsa sp.]MCG6897873.1 protein disulfide oxidoreductase [Thiocapsa sp.]
MSIDDDPTPAARRARRLRRWLIDIALILAIVAGVHWWKARPLVSGEAPPLAELTLDGRALDLADLRGQPVLVHFWASWCPMCKLMDGAVAALARDHPVVTVAMQSGDRAALQDVMRQTGHDFPVIADPTGQIAGRWGVIGVPASFVVDSAGQIRFATVGVSTEPGLRLRMWAAAVPPVQ